MAKGTNQKKKIIYLMKILLECTDESNYLTMPQIIKKLETYDITAERKSIYSDIDALRDYGLDVVSHKEGNETHYFIASREFEIAELKLLVDAVQASKFITSKQSEALIAKLKKQASQNEAKLLQRQVFVANRAKTLNKEILYSIDKIHMAISENYRIKFQYYDWNHKKRKVARHGGEFYEVSPYALSWVDENYYLIGYDNKAKLRKHFRVDRMLKLEVLQEIREGKEEFKDFNIATYSTQLFGMFGGKEEVVKLQFENRFANVVIDRFGKDTTMYPDGEEHFIIHVPVVVSNQFIGWVVGLGDGVTVLGPENVKDRIRVTLEKIVNKYQ